MTAVSETKGQRRRYYKAVTASEVDIITTIKDRVTKVLESVIIVANGGGSTLSLLVKGGATLLYPIINGATFSADAQKVDLNIPLMAGEKVTVQAGAADKLYVILVTIDDVGSKE
jgi:hypothetical protein